MNDEVSEEEVLGLIELMAIGMTKFDGGDYDENYKKAWDRLHDPFVGKHAAKDAGLLIMAARITGFNIRCMPDEDKNRIRVYSDDKPHRCLSRFWDKFKELRTCHNSRDTN